MPIPEVKGVQMSGQINEKERARIRILTRFYLGYGEDFEATKAFDKTVCKALDIDPEVEPPTFLTDPRVLD
jgi:hypothetical protein